MNLTTFDAICFQTVDGRRQACVPYCLLRAVGVLRKVSARIKVGGFALADTPRIT
jgi:hypothetical protein